MVLRKGVLVTLKALNILTKLACLHMFTPEVCDFWWFLVTPACGSWRFWSDRISNACRCTVRWLTDDSPMSWDSLQQGISLILMLSSVSCFYQGTTRNICRKLSMQSRKTELRCLANWPFFSSCEAQLLWLPQFHSIFTWDCARIHRHYIYCICIKFIDFLSVHAACNLMCMKG